MKLKEMTKIRRRKPTLDETACVTLNDAAMFFNMGIQKFRKMFFHTDLCDTIPHVRAGRQGTIKLSLRHVVEAAFPNMDKASQAHIMFDFLRSKSAERKDVASRRYKTIREKAK